MCQGKEAVREGKKCLFVFVFVFVCVFVCMCGWAGVYMSVCIIRSGQEKQSDQRPHGCKCQACQGSDL